MFFENLYFLISNVFCVSKLNFRYLNVPSVDLAIRFKHELYLLIREMRCNVLVFNELPTERKRVKLSQEFYALHTSTTRKYSCFFNSFCVLHYHADLSGVPKVTRVSCIRSYTIKTNVSQRRKFRKWLRYFVFWAIFIETFTV